MLQVYSSISIPLIISSAITLQQNSCNNGLKCKHAHVLLATYMILIYTYGELKLSKSNC